MIKVKMNSLTPHCNLISHYFSECAGTLTWCPIQSRVYIHMFICIERGMLMLYMCGMVTNVQGCINTFAESGPEVENQ